MVTLYIVEQIINLANYLVGLFFSPVVDLLNEMSQYIQAFTIPVVFYDILHLCIFFLPVGTIGILLGFTTMLISVQVIHSVARWIIHFFGLI